MSTAAFAGGGFGVSSSGGSQVSQIGGAAGIYATGAAGAQGSADVATLGGHSSVNNTSTTGTLNGVGAGVGVIGGNSGGFGGGGLVGVAAAGGVSSANNNIQTKNAYGDLQSNTSATNASGVGLGVGGNTIKAGGGNHVTFGH